MNVLLTEISCGECNLPFAIPDSMYRRLKQTGAYLYCPNGHEIHYVDNENRKLKERLERSEKRLAREESRRSRAEMRADHEQRRASTYKGHLTRTKRRVAHGVCPCCKRSFDDLRKHMETKHPEYGSEG